MGANDGIVSTASLVLGVAAAGATSKDILVAGVAGLVAGAMSMAAGEYVSVRSQRDLYEYQIALERQELALWVQEKFQREVGGAAACAMAALAPTVAAMTCEPEP